MLTTIFRRHTATCPHKHKGREWMKCTCPLWGDGYENGKRVFRQSLGTRDVARARKRAVALEASDVKAHKSIPDAVAAFKEYEVSQGHSASTQRKYGNTLKRLTEFCAGRYDTVDELTTEVLDSFRASRRIAPLTSSKELELLRQFCEFCRDRKWCPENAAKKIKGPRHLKPNDKEPYRPEEAQKILAATDKIGRGPYERSRAYAMVLMFRYTALRISDVIFFERSRVFQEGKQWKILLRSQKNGTPVFLTIPNHLRDTLEALPLPRGAAPDCAHYFWNAVGDKRTALKSAARCLRSVFAKAGVANAHSHRFRHTLATELLGEGASFEEVADILGNTAEIVRKHYGKWSRKRQSRIDELMQRVYPDGHDLGTRSNRIM